MPRWLLFLFCFTPSNLLQAEDLVTIAGKKFPGDLVQLHVQTLQFKSGSESISFNYTELMQLDFGNKLIPEQPFIEIELVDGSLLRAKEFSIQGKQIKLVLLSDRTLTLQITQIQALLREAQETKNRLDFKTILKNTRMERRDVYVRSIPDGASRRLDFLTGTFGDGDEAGQKIAFDRSAGGKLNVFQRSIHGLIFNQITSSDRPATLCKVLDIHRNTLYAKSLQLKDGKLVVRTVSNDEFVYPSMQEISRFDFSSSSMRYLSDLEPAKVDESTMIDISTWTRFARDKNLDNTPIKLNTVTYSKGITARARSVITYDIAGEYKEFQSMVGVDDGVETDSEIILTIQGDGRQLFRKTIQRKDKPIPIVADVQNIKSFEIIIEAVGLDLGHQLSLADARVIK